MFTKLFTRLRKSDSKIAGGKGASLGEMTRARIPVPQGFVVLASAFEKFLEETDLGVEIDAILHTVNHKEMHTVEHASEKIQALILGADMPKDITKEIQTEFEKLEAEYVAIRSSATAEDSASAAWAGQLDTFLNTTEECLLKNVQKCWASLFTPRAIFYRHEKKLHTQKISVAVVVQKMIESEVSGIAFSVHPVTEDRNQMIIEAGFGLGEAIVSGHITPDSYVVEKDPRRIIDKNISVQNYSLIRTNKRIDRKATEGGGGNARVELSKEKGGKQKLSDAQILELSDLVLKIENHYGFPCDIEWALADGTVYILQSRPITTLKEASPASTKSQTVYTLVMTRDLPLVGVELWHNAFVWLTGITGIEWPLPLFIYKDGAVESWRPQKVFFNVLPRRIAGWLQSPQHQKTVWKLLDEYDICIKKLTGLKKQTPALPILLRLFRREGIQALGTLILIYWIVEWSNRQNPDYSFPADLVSAGTPVRSKTPLFDDLIDLSYGTLKKLPLPELASFLTASELEACSKSSVAKAKVRIHGYVYIEGEVFPKNKLPSALKQRGYILDEKKSSSLETVLSGVSVVKGKVSGRVKVLKNRTELLKVEKGDILVAPMTTPWYLPAMKKAAAFVTDEGGTLCHAAIVARELNKICIVGTKVATKVLKDGDTVEMDAERGVVRIIK